MISTTSSAANYSDHLAVKTLRVEDGLVEELTRCLGLEDGELPLDLLPELHDLTCSGSGDVGHTFTSSIDARQNAGRPQAVTLVRHNPSSSPSESSFKFEPIAIHGHIYISFTWSKFLRPLCRSP